MRKRHTHTAHIHCGHAAKRRRTQKSHSSNQIEIEKSNNSEFGCCDACSRVKRVGERHRLNWYSLVCGSLCDCNGRVHGGGAAMVTALRAFHSQWLLCVRCLMRPGLACTDHTFPPPTSPNKRFHFEFKNLRQNLFTISRRLYTNKFICSRTSCACMYLPDWNAVFSHPFLSLALSRSRNLNVFGADDTVSILCNLRHFRVNASWQKHFMYVCTHSSRERFDKSTR